MRSSGSPPPSRARRRAEAAEHVAPAAARRGTATRAAIDRFSAALNRQDAGALERLLTEDTVFEAPSPRPDGQRIEGRSAVISYWQDWFAANPGARFDAEEVIVSGDRAVVRWVYRKRRNGRPWHLRGVDVFLVRDGRVAAKLAYVKG